MPVLLTPYLSFRAEAREAMEFYRSIFGGDLTLSTFGDFNASENPVEADKIMHGHLIAGDLNLMGADTPNEMPYDAGTNFAVSLSGGPEDESRLREYWGRLTDDGDVTVDLERSPWGDTFGMLVDRFGVQWMVSIGRASAPAGAPSAPAGAPTAPAPSAAPDAPAASDAPAAPDEERDQPHAPTGA